MQLNSFPISILIFVLFLSFTVSCASSAPELPPVNGSDVSQSESKPDQK